MQIECMRNSLSNQLARIRSIALLSEEIVPPLDRIDIRLLGLVQDNADLSLEALAARVSLSTSQCSRRLQQLREDGYISHVATVLDPKRLGLGLKAYVMVVLRPHPDGPAAFYEHMRRSPEVLECCMITGDADYMLKICTRDLHSFSAFLQELAATNLVASTRSSIVVEERKSTTALPVELSVQGPAGRQAPGGRRAL